MKKMLFALVALLTMSASASAMSYEQARREALFLTDKMAYELNLTDAQYEAAYEINLDYLMGVTSVNDVYGPYWERRNLDLSYILYSWQWDMFRAATYFLRPLYWSHLSWRPQLAHERRSQLLSRSLQHVPSGIGQQPPAQRNARRIQPRRLPWRSSEQLYPSNFWT